jgi:citrate/tricarballylate utilization protein
VRWSTCSSSAAALAIALALGLALFLALAAAGQGGLFAAPAGDFHAIFPHGLMVALFTPVFAFALLALGKGAANFWLAARRA